MYTNPTMRTSPFICFALQATLDSDMPGSSWGQTWWPRNSACQWQSKRSNGWSTDATQRLGDGKMDQNSTSCQSPSPNTIGISPFMSLLVKPMDYTNDKWWIAEWPWCSLTWTGRHTQRTEPYGTHWAARASRKVRPMAFGFWNLSRSKAWYLRKTSTPKFHGKKGNPRLDKQHQTENPESIYPVIIPGSWFPWINQAAKQWVKAMGQNQHWNRLGMSWNIAVKARPISTQHTCDL